MSVGSIEPEETENEVPVARRYPVMEHGNTAGGWTSLYDITPGWHAIMGALPGMEGLCCVAGTSDHGFKLGPAVGEMMADLIVNGKKPGGDINMFGVSRFDAGKEVTGKYEYSIVGYLLRH